MNIIDRLEAVRETGPGKWVARCPGHDDKNPSLAITQGDDGRWLLYCRTGCSINDIVDGLGVTLADLFPEKSPLVDGKQRLRPVKRPFNAAQMLLTLGHEVNVVHVIALSMHCGEVSDDEMNRLRLATSRIAKGISLAGLHH